MSAAEFDVYDELSARGPLSPGMKKCLEDLVTGLDVPCANYSIAAQALDALARELAVCDSVMTCASAEGAVLLSADDLKFHLARIAVRARAAAAIVELLEIQPDEVAAEAEAAQ